MHTPIFEKDQQRFLINARDFVGQDENEARHIGWGASLVECIMLGCKFTQDVLDLEQAEADQLQVTPASLGKCPIFILSDIT